MPPRCSVVTCHNRPIKNKTYLRSEGISYHLFPRDKKLQLKWIEATGNPPEWRPGSNYHTICSEHFEDCCFQIFQNSRRLYQGAVPTLKLPRKKAPGGKTVSVIRSTNDTSQDDGVEREEVPPFLKPEIVKVPECDHNLVAKEICVDCKKEFEHREPHINFFGGRLQSIIANVYHFLEQELCELKNIYGGSVEYAPFRRLRRRTSEATGVCLNTVSRILQEEHEWREEHKIPLKKRRFISLPDDNDVDSNEGCKCANCEPNSDKTEDNDFPADTGQDEKEKPPPDEPFVLNNVISEEDYTKNNSTTYTDDDYTEVVLDTEDVEFEYLDEPMNLSADAAPIGTSDQQYTSMATRTSVDKANNTDIPSSPLGNVETEDYGLYNSELTTQLPSTCNMETQTDSQDGLEPMNLIPSQPCPQQTLTLGTLTPVAPLAPLAPQYCPEQMNPMISPSICTQMEAHPYMAPAQLYCGLDPHMNGRTLIAPPSMPHMEPPRQMIAEPQPQYISAIPGHPMAGYGPDYGRGLNYYVLVDNY